MVGQQGLWDEAERLAKLTRKKPSLERLKAAIPWEEFRPLLESAFAKERQSPAGRKRIDVIVMFKMLVLQQLYNLRAPRKIREVHNSLEGCEQRKVAVLL